MKFKALQPGDIILYDNQNRTRWGPLQTELVISIVRVRLSTNYDITVLTSTDFKNQNYWINTRTRRFTEKINDDVTVWRNSVQIHGKPVIK